MKNLRLQIFQNFKYSRHQDILNYLSTVNSYSTTWTQHTNTSAWKMRTKIQKTAFSTEDIKLKRVCKVNTRRLKDTKYVEPLVTNNSKI